MKDENTIIPCGFKMNLDPIFDGGELHHPTLTLHRKNEPSLEVQFQHPDCEARKLGLCLIAYDLLASAVPQDREFLNQFSIDLRDVLRAMEESIGSTKSS